MKKLFISLTIAILFPAIIGCSGGSGSSADNTPPDGIYIKPLTTIFVDGTEQLTATITPANAANQNVIWSTDSEDIVTVSSDGLITGIAEGEATVTAGTEEGNYQAHCIVTVSPRPVAVSGISLSKNSTNIHVNGTEQLEAEILPLDATNQNVTWATTDEDIVTVSQNGLITGISEGDAAVTVTTADGGYHSECTVTVLVLAVSGVSLDQTTLNMHIDGEARLQAIITPSNATNKNVTWLSSDNSIAEVSSDGLVVANALGSATITVTTEDGGFHAECAVNVTEVPVSSVSLNKSSTSIYVNNTEQLTATVLPSDAANKNVTWLSSNESAATVSTTGLVTGVSAGSATITVTTEDGGFHAECVVTTSNLAVTGISLNKTTMITYTGGTEQLTANVLPANATNKNVTWTTGNSDVAAVSSSGFVTAKTKGEAIITATTEDGSYTAKCTVRVYRPFISTWKTDAPGKASNTIIKLPIGTSGTYNFYVEWGDGSINYVTSSGQNSHIYNTAGTYDIKIYGIINDFGFSNLYTGDYNLCLIDVKQWGDLQLDTGGFQFEEAKNLNGFSASDTPDLSHRPSFACMFLNATSFNGNIGTWNVSTISNMSWMFWNASSFNQDISSWNVSNVTTMYYMFSGAASFNQDISSWNVSKVTDMENMFYNASSFNRDLNSWDTSNVTNMSGMFYGAAAFNGNITSWNVGKVTVMSAMFSRAASFNQDIGSWNVGNVANMRDMFYYASSFNKDLNSWNTANVTNMSGMFNGATVFNGNISSWNVSKVTATNSMFSGAISFNQNIGSWNVSNVTALNNMFSGATSFNQNIGSWNVSNATNFSYMFSGAASFNQNIGSWNVGNATILNNMFRGASSFNQNISSWNTGNVTNMNSMFYNAASFNQDLNSWDVSKVTDMMQMFTGSGMAGTPPSWYH